MPALLLSAVLVLAVFTACSGDESRLSPAAATPPGARATAIEVAERFFTAWREARYADMYALLSPAAQQAISADRFAARYRAITEEATIQGVAVEVQRPADPDTAQIPFTAVYQTALWG